MSGAPGPGSAPPARAAAGVAVRQYRVRASVVAAPENLHRPLPGLTPPQKCPSAAASHYALSPYRTARAGAAAPDASAWPPGAGAPGQAPERPGEEQRSLPRLPLPQAPGPRPGRRSPGSPATALGAQSADAGADAGWYGALQTTGSRAPWSEHSLASPPATAAGRRRQTRRDVALALWRWPLATRRAGS